jgi:hypothetical protein
MLDLDYLNNHIGIAFLLMFLSIAIVIFINVLLFHLHIRTAIKQIVKPELQRNGLTYVDYKWCGFWGCGDFKDNIEFALFKTGLHTTSIYSFIYYNDGEKTKRITIKINRKDFSATQVLYSNKF